MRDQQLGDVRREVRDAVAGLDAGRAQRVREAGGLTGHGGIVDATGPVHDRGTGRVHRGSTLEEPQRRERGRGDGGDGHRFTVTPHREASWRVGSSP